MEPKDIEIVKGMIGEANRPLTEQLTALKGTVDGLPASLTESLSKGLGENVTKSVADAVAKLAPKAPEPKAGDDKDANAQLVALVTEAMKPVVEKLNSIETGVKPVVESHTQSAQRAKAQALVETTLGELKLGGLAKNKAVMERLVAANPADANAVKKLVETERAYAVGLGIKAESFGADVVAEGGKAGEDKGAEQKFIEEIRGRKPVRL